MKKKKSIHVTDYFVIELLSWSYTMWAIFQRVNGMRHPRLTWLKPDYPKLSIWSATAWNKQFLSFGISFLECRPELRMCCFNHLSFSCNALFSAIDWCMTSLSWARSQVLFLLFEHFQCSMTSGLNKIWPKPFLFLTIRTTVFFHTFHTSSKIP